MKGLSKIFIFICMVLVAVLASKIIFASFAISDVSTADSTQKDVVKESGFNHLNISDSSPYDSLVLYMPFDINQSSTVYDYSNYDNDGTLNGNITFNSTGKYDGGYDFDGNDDYVEVSDDDSLEPNTLTVSAWVNLDAKVDYENLVTKWGNYEDQYNMQLDSNGDKYTFAVNTGSTTGRAVSSISSVTGSWVHVVGTWDGSIVKIYINGSEEGSKPLSGTLASSTQNLTFGAENSGDTIRLDGSIDEVMIFNKSLNSTQVQNLYNKQADRFKDTGWQEFEQNITSGNTKINVTSDYEAVLNSNLTLELSYYDSGWTSAGSQLVAGENSYSISNSATNVSLNYSYNAGSDNGSYSFYSPILKNDITLDTYSSEDTTNPDVSIGKNASQVEFNQESININWTASDETSLDTTIFNVTYPNGSLLFESSGAIGEINLTPDNLTELGTYNINLWANDTSGNENSITDSFSVDDTIAPSVKITSPENGKTFSYPTSSVSLNVTTDEESICNYSLNSGANQSMTANASGTGFNASLTVNSGNSYTAEVYCEDIYGNLNDTESVSFSVNATPSIQIESLYSTTDINVTQNEFFNVTLNVSCFDADCGDVNVTLDPVSWLSGWAKRNEITINSSKIDSDLNHFPVPITLGTSAGESGDDVSSVFDEVGSNSKKIAVTKGDGTSQLYTEIEKWNSTSEEAVLWVSKSDWNISNSTDTTLYLYYDNSHSNNTAYIGNTGSTTAENVWDPNTKATWHLREEQSGTGNTGLYKDSTKNSNDGDDQVSATGQEGQIDGGQEFDGNDDYINIGTCGCGAEPATYSFWLKFTGENESIPFGIGESLQYPFELKLNPYGASGGMRVYMRDTDGNALEASTGDVGANDGSWHHWVIAVDSANNVIDIYKDGTDLDVSTDNNDNPDNFNDYGTDFLIGAFNDRGFPESHFEGSIDEFRISGIARSNDEIKANYYAQSDELLSFGTEEIESAWKGIIPEDSGTPFYTNKSSNPYTLTSMTAGESREITFYVNATGSIDSTHEFFAFANMTSDSSISNETSHWNVTIQSPPDVTPPEVTTIPANETIEYGIDWNGVEFDAIDDSGIDSWFINDSSNFSIDSNGYLDDNPTLSVGTYSVNVSVNDTAGNVNSTVYELTVEDTTAPDVSIHEPTSTTYADDNINLNTTISDAQVVDSCWYSLDDWATNASFDCNHTTFTASEGSNTVRVAAKDSLGNLNDSESVSFTVDTQAPNVTVDSPQNSTYSFAQVDVNATVTDASSVDSVLAEVDGSENISLVHVSGDLYSNSSYSFTDGHHTVRVYANDTLGNLNDSETVSFTVDSSAPNVTIDHPLNSTYSFAQVDVNATVVDSSTVDSVLAEVDGSENITLTLAGGDVYSNSSHSFAEGHHTIRIYANDSLGNLNDSESVSFTVGTSAPNVSIHEPTSITYADDNIALNTTVVDDQAVDSCWYSLDNWSTNVSYDCDYAIVNGAEGNNTLWVAANDSVGNVNDYKSVSFIVDTTDPSVDIHSPENITYPSPSIGLNASISDNNLENCWYVLDNGSSNHFNCTYTQLSLSEDNYLLEVFANDSAGNIGSSQVSFTVDYTLDLNVSDMNLSSEMAVEGDFITVDSLVQNLGTDDCNNCEVGLLVDGNLEQTRNLSIRSNSSNTTFFEWTAVAGTHILTVQADPSNLINETNESNNNLSKEVYVGSVQEDEDLFLTVEGECVNESVTVRAEDSSNDSVEGVDIEVFFDGSEVEDRDTDSGGGISFAPEETGSYSAEAQKTGYKDISESFSIESCVSCSDGILNQGETDVDCGGSCPACEDGNNCSVDSDCQSGWCYEGECRTSTCDDGILGPEEVEIDCGGPCEPCETTCNDSILNQDETDVDCGGSCDPCEEGMSCENDSDCESDYCYNGICLVPSCSDGILNQDETDVDCGGRCPPCSLNSSCDENADCESGWCYFGECRRSTCEDQKKGPTEEKVDCGGPCEECPFLKLRGNLSVENNVSVVVMYPREELRVKVIGPDGEVSWLDVGDFGSSSYKEITWQPEESGEYELKLLGYGSADYSSKKVEIKGKSLQFLDTMDITTDDKITSILIPLLFIIATGIYLKFIRK